MAFAFLKVVVIKLRNMKYFLFIILVSTGFNSQVLSQQMNKVNIELEKTTKINEVIFEINGVYYTEFDVETFKKVYSLVKPAQINQIFQLDFNQEEIFLISRMIEQEAIQLELLEDQNEVKKFAKTLGLTQFYEVILKAEMKSKNKDFQKVDINQIENSYLLKEVRTESLVNQFLVLKSVQFQNRVSLIGWLQVLKRKFNFQYKSDEYKNKITFRL